MPLATIKVLPISERCGWPTAIEIVAINQRQKAPATPLYRGKYSRFSKVRQWACQKNFSLLLRRRITKKTRRIPNPSCFLLPISVSCTGFEMGQKKAAITKRIEKKTKACTMEQVFGCFWTAAAQKGKKQKPNGRQKKAQKPPVFSAKIGHRNPSPNHGSPFSHGHAKSKHKLAGMEKECTKTIAKQKSRPKATDVGAFIRGPLLYGTIRHQGQQKEKAGPHRKMRPPIGKDTKNNTDQFSRTAGA